MEAAFAKTLSGGRIEVRSAGSAPADSINPVVREAMAEVGIDLAAARPRVLVAEDVQSSDVVITMGCGDACPFFPARAMRIGSWPIRLGRTLPPCA